MVADTCTHRVVPGEDEDSRALFFWHYFGNLGEGGSGHPNYGLEEHLGDE
jgi:hypothetical protein